MASDPYFPVFARDFLADPFVDAMTPEELGGYWRLLLIAWQQTTPGYLPNDPEQLARWSRLGARRWKVAGAAILRCFRVSEDGRTIWQKRMVAIAIERQKFIDQQRQKGLASAARRSPTRFNEPARLELTTIAQSMEVRAESQNFPNHGSIPVQPHTQPKGNSASASASALPQTRDTEETHADLRPAESTPAAQAELIAVQKPPDRFDFESLYKLYPRKDGKADGMKLCRARIKTVADFEALGRAVRNYAEKCRIENKEKTYTKQFDTFMRGAWRDYIDETLVTAPAPAGRKVARFVSRPELELPEGADPSQPVDETAEWTS